MSILGGERERPHNILLNVTGGIGNKLSRLDDVDSAKENT
jgi:hypothetical protein